MDQLWSLMLYLNGLLASSVMLMQLIFGSASATLTSLSSSFEKYFSSPGAPLAQEPISATSTPTTIATSTSLVRSATASSTATTTKTSAKKPVVAQTLPPQPTTPKPAAIVPPEEVNIAARASIVNILCIAQGGSEVRSVSGSGVIIDARGVVLTNAHIAQYLLLRDYPTKNAVDCSIRTGSPAAPLYRATLLYLPPAWIQANASQITAAQGVGTGEHDYAFLHINEPISSSVSLPASFNNLPMSAASPDTGDSVLVAGYPAGFLDGQTIQRNLYATSAFTLIGQLYTFNAASNVDVVSLGGTVVSQGGSSGGAVLRLHDGKLVGLISTATPGETTSSRDLRAITIGYIDRSLREGGKGGLVEFLSGNLNTIAADFAAQTFNEEKQALLRALGK